MKRELLIPIGLAALVLFTWRGAFGCDVGSGSVALNVLLHAANVVLIWALLRAIPGAGSSFGAVAAASLFAVHPGLAEAVMETGTIDPLRYTTMAAIVLVGAMAVLRRRAPADGRVPGSVLIVVAIVVASGSILINLLTGGEDGWSLLAVAGVVAEVLVAPWRASAYYDPPGVSAALHGTVLLATSIALAVAAVVRPRKGLVCLGGVWMLAAVLPLLMAGPGMRLDERAVLVVAGFAITLAGILSILHDRRPVAAWIALASLAALGALGVDRQAERWASPETVWRRAVKRAPRSAWPRYQLAGAVLARAADEVGAAAARRLDEALVLYREVAATGRDPVARGAKLDLAALSIRLGRFQEGLDAYAEVGFRPYWPEDVTTYASALVATGEIARAEELLAEGLERWPESVDLRNLAATVTVIQARRRLGAAVTDAELAEARAECERGMALYAAILEDHPDHLKTRCDHAKAVIGSTWLRDHPILTTRIVNDLVQDFPRDGYAKYLRARVLADADADEAIRELDEAILLDPLREEPYELLSHLLVGRGRTKEAKLVLDKGLETIPGSARLEARLAELMIALARHHQSSGAPDLASRAAERAAELAPHAVEPWLVLGEMHLERAQMPDVAAEERDQSWVKAKHAYDRAFEIDPENPTARDGLAQYYRARGYGVLLTIKNATRGLEGKALVERRHELRRRAMFDFRRALDLTPDDEGAASLRALTDGFADELRGSVHEQLDLVPGAATLELARDVELLAPRDPESHVLVAAVQHALGRYDAALDAYEAALAIDPAHLRATWESGRILYAERRWEDAAERIGRFLDLAKKSPASAVPEGLATEARDMLEQCRRRM